MRVLVTGGAGYIGSNAVYKLIEKGFEVIIIDSLERGHKENLHPQANFYKCDLRDFEQIDKVLQKEKNIDVVMHFAGFVKVEESVKKPILYFDQNLNSTIQLLKALKKHEIKKIIFSSTAALYNQKNMEPINEECQTNPKTPYGLSKLFAEEVIKNYSLSDSFQYVIFRYFNVAGANDNLKLGLRGTDLTHVIPNITLSAIENKRFNIYGNDYDTKDGTCIRDFIHIEDLVEAHIMGIDFLMKNRNSEIFNLGSEKGYSIYEVVKESQKILPEKLDYKFSERRNGDTPFVLASSKKAHKLLNWSAKKTLKEIILSDYKFRKINR